MKTKYYMKLVTENTSYKKLENLSKQFMMMNSVIFNLSTM